MVDLGRIKMLTVACPSSVDMAHPQRRIALIPAYNEERFIASVVLKTRRYVDEVLVVDDGSQDATAELAQEAGATVLYHSENQGKGAALNTGFAAVRAQGGGIVVTLDADGQHEPAELLEVIAPICEGKADLVIGSRYLVKESDVPPSRVWGHRFFNFLTKQASGVSVSDSQSGYRAFSTRALELLDFSSRSFSVESEMQFLARQYDLRVVEVPIVIRYTDKPKRSVLQHGMIVLNGVLQLTGQYRPLLYFGVPGMAMLLSGLLWGLWVVNIFQRTGELAVGYAILSTLLAVLGMITLSTAVTLHSVRGLLQDFLRTAKECGPFNGS
jgi:glycosyltransferase involved in cell wall biosynthesis